MRRAVTDSWDVSDSGRSLGRHYGASFSPLSGGDGAALAGVMLVIA